MAISAEEQLRRNVLELMKEYRWNQAQLAALLGRSQSWVSRRLSEKAPADGGTRFQFEDLDGLSRVFALSPAELLEPRYGKWDRRVGADRRRSVDRRARHLTAAQVRVRRWLNHDPAISADDPKKKNGE